MIRTFLPNEGREGHSGQNSEAMREKSGRRPATCGPLQKASDAAPKRTHAGAPTGGVVKAKRERCYGGVSTRRQAAEISRSSPRA